jgi:hypothetical protein
MGSNDSSNIGGLVGTSVRGLISDSHASGNVEGNQFVGGL